MRVVKRSRSAKKCTCVRNRGFQIVAWDPLNTLAFCIDIQLKDFCGRCACPAMVCSIFCAIASLYFNSSILRTLIRVRLKASLLMSFM